MKKLLYILVILLSIQAFSQERLYGKVVSYNEPVPGVYVINKRTGDEVKTDNNGLFGLEVKTGDELAVYSPKIITRNFTVNKKWFDESPFILSVDQQFYELEEVVIDNRITSESLGLVPKGQKQYTPAERRLKAAGDMTPTWLAGPGSIGGAVPFDPIINALTGRTRMLKNALETERKEALKEKIAGIYSEDKFIDELRIPKEYVEGFVFYLIEDVAFVEALKANNPKTDILLVDLSVKYLELLKG